MRLAMAGASCTAAATVAHSAHLAQFCTLSRGPASRFPPSSHHLLSHEFRALNVSSIMPLPLPQFALSCPTTFAPPSSRSTSRHVLPAKFAKSATAEYCQHVGWRASNWTKFAPGNFLSSRKYNAMQIPFLERRSSGVAYRDRVWSMRRLTVCAKLAEIEQVPAPDSEERSYSLAVPEYRKRLRIADIKGGAEEGLERVGEKMLIRGWVRTCRVQKTFSFIEINDGSTLSNLQAVVESDAEGYDTIESGLITTGSSVAVEGELIASQGSKQKVELKGAKVVLIGRSDPTTFPVQKKKQSREYLRTIAHMRPRTNTFGAVARVRNALAYATHQFFQGKGFVWIASPIITASDCEGAGEQFCVTTLVPESPLNPKTKISDIPSTKDGLVDWSQDFFGKPAFLTVSGQLNAEIYATSLSDVYTFGPTFRAENSNTSRHLAEFWMIEPELAFADLKDDMACATAYLKYAVKYVLENCKEDMAFFEKWIDKGIISRLTDVAEKDFVHITYTDAVDILKRAKKKFEYPVSWGSDLQSEHERYLTEEIFKGAPVIVTDYPKDIKAFYMRVNDDQKTVAAMDVLVPRVGELIGGSQREERLELLEKRIDDLGLNKENFWWYLDLRRYGTVPHAGFGLGFERLVQFATGMENIRDAIPFPRTPGSAEF